MADWSLAEKQRMMALLRSDYPVNWLCELLELLRSSYYYQPPTTDETAVVMALEQLLMRRPFYGYRRLVAQLRREGFTGGERVVRRLLHS